MTTQFAEAIFRLLNATVVYILLMPRRQMTNSKVDQFVNTATCCDPSLKGNDIADECQYAVC